ncbi:hypothetical protein GCM10010172_75220 [Paractinoplanes ferrugineus]|uniref:Uncharacterized protein n=1 Tax=Paractinoplanes ferrugineus TaxID=113564 RepID=A0A919J1Q5_9ACTN|nr:hypothetical protein Afe05nite_31630 [Actinoplanes ferrugineus]
MGGLRPAPERSTGTPIGGTIEIPAPDDRWSGMRDLLERRGMDMALIAGLMIFYGLFIGVALSRS